MIICKLDHLNVDKNSFKKGTLYIELFLLIDICLISKHIDMRIHLFNIDISIICPFFSPNQSNYYVVQNPLTHIVYMYVLID